VSDRLRVLLLFGGRSAEHDVSRATAVSVARALDPQRYEVVPVAITTEGAWLHADAAAELLAGARDALPAAFAVTGTPVLPPAEAGRAEILAVDGTRHTSIDVVLPLLHGPFGEDGTVQGLLELAGLPFVGSGVLGSAVCMDKRMMKRALRACGLPVARHVEFRDGHDREELRGLVGRALGYPCFVKPANMGSSVGVSKAHDEAEFDAAIERALAFDEWILVEEAIVGREIEVAVLGDDPPVASVPGEVVPGEEFYSYEDKYELGLAQLRIPAPLDPGDAAAVRELACRAFSACGCEAMARVDFFFAPHGPGFVVNELNTIPGFTQISMYPKLWEASGVPYGELLDRLIALALERHARRARRAGRQRD
jgi:D-alanine--D-alanine ligase